MHLPLFLIPGWSSSPVWTYVLIQIGASVILALSVNVAKFSVVSAIAVHALFNTASRFLGGILDGVPLRETVSIVVLLAFGGLATAAAIAAITKGRLGYAADTFA